MQFWIVGTDTDVGKTTVSAWICLHTTCSYWKPVQTGCFVDESTGVSINSDSSYVKNLTNTKIHPESYVFRDPLSPHMAAARENTELDPSKIIIPQEKNLLIEAAGGLYVPLTDDMFYIDFIESTKLPVILVARSGLGTINHTCLSVEALRGRNIPLFGVIVNGETNPDNIRAIEKFANVRILAGLHKLEKIETETLRSATFPLTLKCMLESPA
ncbi:ATP-dependent dethiobiotin synthetase BioD [Alphaproteobacteria bacterium]|nr:ATP-dependent dethiobiotin synthetase BioD [Alphaproteobacteria bacterium]